VLCLSVGRGGRAMRLCVESLAHKKTALAGPLFAPFRTCCCCCCLSSFTPPPPHPHTPSACFTHPPTQLLATPWVAAVPAPAWSSKHWVSELFWICGDTPCCTTNLFVDWM
jgi:hypothetical protein